MELGYELTYYGSEMNLKFHLKSPELSFFLGGEGGSRKDHLVTLRLGRAGLKGLSDDVTLYDIFFDCVPNTNTKYLTLQIFAPNLISSIPISINLMLGWSFKHSKIM